MPDRFFINFIAELISFREFIFKKSNLTPPTASTEVAVYAVTRTPPTVVSGMKSETGLPLIKIALACLVRPRASPKHF